jgi:hypothetical protein
MRLISPISPGETEFVPVRGVDFTLAFSWLVAEAESRRENYMMAAGEKEEEVRGNCLMNVHLVLSGM